MKRIGIGLFVAVAALCMMPDAATATPVYLSADTCPDSTGGGTRQYYAQFATACVYDNGVANIQGTTAEAGVYLDATLAQPTWGTGWVGLGQFANGMPSAFATGLEITIDAGARSGTYGINTAVLNYGQFALGIKDGGEPKWAIFLLPVGTLSGNWAITSSGGSLSHMALYARAPGISVPDGGATLALLGCALLGLGALRRRFRG